ncbi:hypothetical protein AQJ11_28995 [Streptomyces corchorusii]|uniref:Short-chain dehydrogenase n=2 Tax=Streptomyces TaxID=1883 RepID=A0A101PZ05_STRCK|nr:SDR family NAD(P)-dependent oxidoreductase [Streptomyces corchorusii]KUN20254.1 hypothetical protein AQJ11_28995 [Streptomyces corchorusii]
MRRPVALISGSTSGPGRSAALSPAGRDCHIGVVARSRGEAEAPVAEPETVADDVQVDVFQSTSHSCPGRAASQRRSIDRYPQLDVLAGNAALHAFSQRVTAEGFVETTAVNYLSPFALPQALTGLLTATGRDAARPARISNVAAGGGYFSVCDAGLPRCPEPGRAPAVQAELWEAAEALLTDGAVAP